MSLSNLTNPSLAAMLRGYAIGRPDFEELASEVIARLCRDADRKKTDRQTPDCVRTVSGRAPESGAGEGGLGGEVSGIETPFLSQNQGIKTNTEDKDSLSQPKVRLVQSGRTPDAVRTLVQTDSRGWTRGFSRFFAAYPDGRKVKTCAVQWVSLGLEEHTDRVLGGLEIWKMCEQWRSGYTPSMRVFLTEALWEQAPPAPKTTAKAEPDAPIKDSTESIIANLRAEKERRKANGIR